MDFATLRLGKTSVEDIKTIDAQAGGVLPNGLSVNVTCTQIPAEFVPGVYVFIWLGSDNSKGIPTEWKQGFKAVGTLTSITRGEKYNDESTSQIEIKYIFRESISRLDILRDSGDAYYWCSSMPIIGLDDHSNQTIRMIDPAGELSSIGAFFKVLASVRPEFEDEIVSCYPDFSELFHYIVRNPRDPNPGEAQGNTLIDSQEQKRLFKEWLQIQTKADGQRYSENTINSYISQMSRGYEAFEPYREYTSPFAIQDAASLDEYTAYLFSAPGFDDFNDHAGNKACSYGFLKYKEYLRSLAPTVAPLRYNTPLQSAKSRNRIIFGAPGTGKSFTLNQERKELLGENDETSYERVTFHPDYSYASFVGTYKPVPKGEVITYEYVPGPFMRVYVNALKNGRTDDVKPYLLIIEEINRANVAAVFGEVFQLLDRDDNDVSEYPIQASEDIKSYLANELGGSPEDYGKIRIPNNMFIWATMNSADQGVFPMDTAFKRRWDFTYIGINESEEGIRGKTVILGRGTYARNVEWNSLRQAINERLSKFKINEDKLLGPYFLSRKVVPETGEIDSAVFCSAFKNKVLMYLFDDAAKQKRSSLFAEDVDTTKYSAVCSAFDDRGVFVFCSEISNRFQNDMPPTYTEGDDE